MTSSVAVFEAAIRLKSCIWQNRDCKPGKKRNYDENHKNMYINLHLNFVQEWCQRERWHHLPYVTTTLLYGSGIVIDVTK